MSAVISACGRYRYRLERTVSDGKGVICFVGVNPSVADATINDHTITKLMQFTRLWNGRKLIVGNLFAFRSTDVKGLKDMPYDPEAIHINRVNLVQMFHEADWLVPMWGDLKKLPVIYRPRAHSVLASMFVSGKPVGHLGLTKGGDPKHPLMLPYTTPLTFYKGTT